MEVSRDFGDKRHKEITFVIHETHPDFADI